MQQAQAGRRAVFFVDAAHFVYGPFPGSLWCLARLFVPGPSGRKRYNVLAALNAVTRRVIRVPNPSYINASSVCDLLRRVAAAGPGVPVTLVPDDARYRRCAAVQGPAQTPWVGLLFLPSDSPNLNRIERLWKFVKKECLGCRPQQTYEAFTGAIDACLSGLTTRHKQQMKTLLTLKFQTFEDEPIHAA